MDKVFRTILYAYPLVLLTGIFVYYRIKNWRARKKYTPVYDEYNRIITWKEKNHGKN